MKIIRIKFEYKCFPVWIYSDDNILIENDLPANLIGDSDIDPQFVALQEKYDSLYVDDGKEFRFKDFENDKCKEDFIAELNNAIETMKQKIGDDYIVEERDDYFT